MGNETTGDGIFGCEMNFNKFSETTAVVISRGFCISKSFQQWVSYIRYKRFLIDKSAMCLSRENTFFYRHLGHQE